MERDHAKNKVLMIKYNMYIIGIVPVIADQTDTASYGD